MSEKIYEIVTDRMITALEGGTIPWQRPWTAGGRPKSMSTGKYYGGVNILLLGLTAAEKGYASPFWGTYDQIAELAGMVRVIVNGRRRWVSPDGTSRGVREGEKSTLVIFWKQYPVEDRDTGKEKTIPVLRYFRVFNAAQADALPAKFFPQVRDVPVAARPQAVLDAYLARGGPQLQHGGDRAHYNPASDVITLPARGQFRSSEHYYATSFHEAIHSTGHKGRLARAGVQNFDHFGSERYAKEELVAQMGAAMLQAETGIDTPGLWDNSVAYVQSWLRTLKNDKKLVVGAAGQAQRAADLVLAASATEGQVMEAELVNA